MQVGNEFHATQALPRRYSQCECDGDKNSVNARIRTTVVKVVASLKIQNISGAGGGGLC
jgi:hypothetical protein